MPVQIACPNTDCDASYTIADTNLGRVGRCKKCGTKFPLVPPTRETASETDFDSFPRPQPPPESDLPTPFGRYEIIKLLGKGGMGAVYLAQDGQLERRVALKVPHREFAQSAEIRERFLREARAAARFHHPNFCPIFDIGEIDGRPYLTMAYIEGGTLGSTIERGKPWDQRKAADVVRQLAVALAEAHRQGVVHRDLKPANVMIDPRGNLVLMDFGLARRLESEDATLTNAGAILGTPAYMPPEQAEGDLNAIGPCSDIYSLGVIFYELLTGRLPFEGPITKILGMIVFVEPSPPSTLRKGLDPRLEAICLKAMAKKPANRHASMDKFAGELAEILDVGEWTEILAEEAEAPRVVPPKPSAQSFPEIEGRKRSSILDSELPDENYPESSENATSGNLSPILIGVVAALAFVGLLLGIFYMANGVIQQPPAVRPPTLVVQAEPPATLTEARPSGSPRTMLTTVQAEPPATPTETPNLDPIPPAGKALATPPVVDETLVTNSLGMSLRLIPGGEFDMGSDGSDPHASDDEMVKGEKPSRFGRDASDDEKVKGKKHHVRITRPFYLGTTEVTVGQFRKFVEQSGYKTEAEKFTEKYRVGDSWRSLDSTLLSSADHPVVYVSWDDSVAFCAWLSKKEGQTYRLPTEAEWEYSCRAGQSSRYSSGDDEKSLASVGYVGHSGGAQPVGRLLPNRFGLFDMHGNVREWCADSYNLDYYAASPAADPMNSHTATERVIRGGGWYNYYWDCRSASRSRGTLDYRDSNLGFRVARDRSGQ